MGKIVYEPKRIKDEVKVQPKPQENQLQQEETSTDNRYNALIDSIDSVRPIGDTDCDYIMYLEDYAYTYMYQFAATDLSYEHTAAIVGEYYPETKENIICGIIPIPQHKLNPGEEWLNKEAIESLLVEKEKYFPGTIILGWMHMQPGYGTMLTMKEVKVHRELFDREGSLLLLVDPINKIETFYIYEDDTLKEQAGYYLYYDKNPSMQKYMLENPFMNIEKEQQEDTVVNQFREMGRQRKKEYQQRKKTNFTVVAACVGLLVVAGLVAKQGNDGNELNKVQPQVQVDVPNNKVVDASSDQVNFIIEPTDKVEADTTENKESVAVSPEEIIDAASDKVVEEVKEEVKEEAKEEAKEEVKEEITKEEVKEDIAVEKEERKEVAVKEEPAKTVKEELVEGKDYILYTVEDGDTLRKISEKHYKTELRTKEIIKLNEIENGDNIFPGQKLKLPVE
ncbi:MAG: LysM peptidoglycan-binding domain-containing protein [Cellulosilyticaceae bacterium]